MLAVICGAGLLLASASGSVAFAATNDNTKEVCKGIEATGGDCNPDDTVNKIIKNIINVFSWVVGVVAVIMVMYGGFVYVTAGGDSAKVTKGRQVITYALIGLVIVALAQVIVKFVLGAATSNL